jgi:stage III sporulation protein AC
MEMDITIVYKIATVGILIAVLNQVLKSAGRDDQATMTTLAGVLLVLFWIIEYISELFSTVQQLFML